MKHIASQQHRKIRHGTSLAHLALLASLLSGCGHDAPTPPFQMTQKAYDEKYGKPERVVRNSATRTTRVYSHEGYVISVMFNADTPVAFSHAIADSYDALQRGYCSPLTASQRDAILATYAPHSQWKLLSQRIEGGAMFGTPKQELLAVVFQDRVITVLDPKRTSYGKNTAVPQRSSEEAVSEYSNIMSNILARMTPEERDQVITLYASEQASRAQMAEIDALVTKYATTEEADAVQRLQEEFAAGLLLGKEQWISNSDRNNTNN